MRHLNRGELLTTEELIELSNNFQVGFHSLDRMNERNMTMKKIKAHILNPYLAYFNTDGTINVAIDKFNYFVFDYNSKYNSYFLITFKEPSLNNITIDKKRRIAQEGYGRKTFKNNFQKPLDKPNHSVIK